MKKVLHPNRWLMWTISIVVVVFVFVWGQVELYATEAEQDGIMASFRHDDIPLGSLAWKATDSGKIFVNNKYGLDGAAKYILDEATYPTPWVSAEDSSRVYFSNKSHQCVLTIGEAVPSVDTYSFVGEKAFSTNNGDINLSIYKNNVTNEQRYFVQPAGSSLQKMGSDHVFGLIRVDDPDLCVDTFGKILASFKFSEKK